MQQAQVIALRSSRVPKFIGELSHSNQFLKIFAISAMVLSLLTLGVLTMQLSKEPLVITLAPDGKTLEKIIAPSVEDQIKEGIKSYLEKRYQWEPDTVTKKLKESESYIMPDSLNAFKGAASNISRFSTTKLVSQKVFPEKIDVDIEKQLAIVHGERITSIQGLKAAGGLKLQLHFRSGTRTKDNPWGLYISKEIEM